MNEENSQSGFNFNGEINQQGSFGQGIGENKGTIHHSGSYSESNNIKNEIEEVTKEIQAIFDNLSETHPANTATEKLTLVNKAVETIEKKSELKTKIVNSLRAGLIEALKQTIKHPAIKIFTEAIKEWK